VHWIRDVALFLALGWLLLVALTTARAQEPTPEPTPDEFIAAFCANGSVEGGETRIVDGVEITLPPGTYNLIVPPPDPGDPVFLLCHIESGGFLSMDATNCEENSRVTPNAEAEAVIELIVTSCRVAPAPTPEPTPVFACPDGETVAGATTITIEGSIEVTLPPGTFVIYVGDDDLAHVCDPDAQYSVVLRLTDCTTPVISPPNDPNVAVRQAILDACVALSPPPTLTPSEQAAGLIQPPNTGSAGLRAK
jgi:hypothetical protein